MGTSPPSRPAASGPRAARVAVAALFLTNGAVFANVVPRYPEIKQHLDLTNAALGTAVAAFPFGALLAGLLASTLISRFRSARVAVFGMVALAGAIVLVSVAPSWGALALVMFAGGGLDAVIDVAQNAHGLRVQRAYGRSILNSFHALWSIGAVLGGLMGAAAAGLSVPLGPHLAVSGALFATVALVSARFLLSGPDDAERVGDAELTAAADGHASSPTPVRRGLLRADRTILRVLLTLGVVAACGALVEDGPASWGALFLRTELGAAAATAGLAFVGFQVAMTVGRLVGDRAVDRFGQRRVVRAGGALAAVAMGLALAFPSVPMVLAGFTLAGLGEATVVPAAMHAADELPGLRPGAGLMIVSWLLRVGFLVGPPVVGVVADATSLRVGLLSMVAAGAVVVALARALRRPS